MFRFWKRDMQGKSQDARLFNVIKQPQNDYISTSDFYLILEELLAKHPGLQFLKQTPIFQRKYAETVLSRIFYTVNRSGTGNISFSEFKKSKLVDALQFVSNHDEINEVWQMHVVIV